MSSSKQGFTPAPAGFTLWFTGLPVRAKPLFPILFKGNYDSLGSKWSNWTVTWCERNLQRSGIFQKGQRKQYRPHRLRRFASDEKRYRNAGFAGFAL